MRPVFGDKATIARVDPFRVLLDEGIDLPIWIMSCAECGAPIHVEFDATWIQGDSFGAEIFRWYCTARGYFHDQGHYMQDDVMRDEDKIVAYIQKLYPTFENEC